MAANHNVPAHRGKYKTTPRPVVRTRCCEVGCTNDSFGFALCALHYVSLCGFAMAADRGDDDLPRSDRRRNGKAY